MPSIVEEALNTCFDGATTFELLPAICASMRTTFDKKTTLDAQDQMQALADSAFTVIVNTASMEFTKSQLTQFRSQVTTRLTELLQDLRKTYLTGLKGTAPAAHLLGKTSRVYLFIRNDLRVQMHGLDNINGFRTEDAANRSLVGQSVSVIYEVSVQY